MSPKIKPKTTSDIREIVGRSGPSTILLERQKLWKLKDTITVKGAERKLTLEDVEAALKSSNLDAFVLRTATGERYVVTADELRVKDPDEEELKDARVFLKPDQEVFIGQRDATGKANDAITLKGKIELVHDEWNEDNLAGPAVLAATAIGGGLGAWAGPAGAWVGAAVGGGGTSALIVERGWLTEKYDLLRSISVGDPTVVTDRAWTPRPKKS